MNIVLLLLITLCYGFTPEVTTSRFDKPLIRLQYFDDSQTALSIIDKQLYVSQDDGKTWNSAGLSTEVIDFSIDKVDPNRGFAFSKLQEQFITEDKGATWRKFTIGTADNDRITVQTNYQNRELALLKAANCNGQGEWTFGPCKNTFFYSTDGLKSFSKLEIDNADQCTFTKSSSSFTEGADTNIFCVQKEFDKNDNVKDARLISSSDWFKTSLVVNDPSGSLKTANVLEVAVVEKFIVAAIQMDRYDRRSNVDFYVSKDGLRFQKADLDESGTTSMYYILPSTRGSLHIATMKYKNSMDMFPISELYRSDSSGVHFTKTMSDGLGWSSARKVSALDGVWFVQQMDNNNMKTIMTMDDGHSWTRLTMEGKENCNGEETCFLNIVMMEEQSGAEFITGPTPGILMGVGTVGDVASMQNFKTYVSRDGGITWKKALDEVCAFSFGDQGNVIVAVPFSMGDNSTSKVHFSLDQGESWEDFELESAIVPMWLVTTVDGSSTNFLLGGFDSDRKSFIYSLDFSKAFGKCTQDDLEEWNSRVDPSTKEPICVFGHKERFMRRKQDAKCFLNNLYVDLKPIEEKCACTKWDLECGPGFDGEDCHPNYEKLAKLCQDEKSTLTLSSQVFSQDTLCLADDPNSIKVERDDFKQSCKEILAKAGKSGIRNTVTKLDATVVQYTYLKSNNAQADDETVLVRTTLNDVFVSFDGGMTFTKMDVATGDRGRIVSIYVNPYFANYVYLITSNSHIYVSDNRGITFTLRNAPAPINELGLRLLSFHERDPAQFIWYGEQNCDNFFNADCRVETFYTTNAGESFSKLRENVRNCHYVGSKLNNKLYNIDDNLIMCEQKTQDHFFQLVSTSDYFHTESLIFDKIVGMAPIGEFLVVAAVDTDNKSLKAYGSVDGTTFAEAHFPPDFVVDKQQAYTIIDASSKAIFMHVTTNPRMNAELGAILKSNFNGTSYVLSAENVNRNAFGFVDYEKVQGLEGVSLINQVSNAAEVISKNSPKHLKTLITHNDGSQWSYVVPPAIDSQGQTFECNSKSLERCSLNLHGFTERVDARDTYASGSAVGMMMALGNVGPFLTDEKSLFLTKDAGITWREVKKGSYMWEYGDQGTILVVVQADTPTDTVSYSLDEGETWTDHKFAESLVVVQDLATVPSDTSRKFLLVSEAEIYGLDFTNIHQRQCQLDLDDESRNKDDFEYWSPTHPGSPDNCLFGHQSLYLKRKQKSTDCFIGAAPLSQGYKVLRNCSCTRNDYECDYNYVRAKDGTCKLVEGFSPPDHSLVCSKDEKLLQFWEPTGYRKIPLSTCKDGKQFDKWIAHPCPGKEREFEHRHRMSGAAVCAVILIPTLVFIFAVWFVYDKGVRRNGGFSRLGEIRLGEDEDDFQMVEETASDRVVNRIVKAGIFVVAGLLNFGRVVRNFFKTSFRFSTQENYSSLNDRFMDDTSTLGSIEEDARDIDSLLAAEFDDPDPDDFRIDDDESR